MQDEFFSIADAIGPLLRGDEIYTCSFSGESSDFVRFTRGAVRQAGTVVQRGLAIDLISGRRHAAGTLTLSGTPAADRAALHHLIAELRAVRAAVPDDPYLLYATDVRSSSRARPAALPDGTAVVDAVRRADGADVVGIYAAGASYAGFANAFGQRNWSVAPSFNLDWSVVGDADRAVKASYAGTHWDGTEFERQMDAAVQQLAALARPPRAVRPGRYRTYLAPAAMFELVGVLGWGGFGLRAHRTKTTPLIRMTEQGARLHPSVQITENIAEGIAPDFEPAGFRRPDRVMLIRDGAYGECLASPRSAAEYGVPTNGASGGEAPVSIDVGAGELPRDAILRALGTGLYVSNLWYLNFSDRSACRTTGMTRFATFWVERGEVVAPVEAMRFDETIYRMLGDNLIGLTAERELILDPGSYGRRSTDSARLPGALVDEFTLTL
jgi:predicted Zn-dependent protease